MRIVPSCFTAGFSAMVQHAGQVSANRLNSAAKASRSCSGHSRNASDMNATAVASIRSQVRRPLAVTVSKRPAVARIRAALDEAPLFGRRTCG